jgi:hypothetical protein
MLQSRMVKFMSKHNLDEENDWAKRERELNAFQEVLDEFLETVPNALLTKGVVNKFRKFLNDKVDKGWRP